jgi:hypothetical protein
MKVARLFGVVLVAVFAMGALLASTASAIPKFTILPSNRAFTATSGLAVLRTPGEKIAIDCAKSTATGTITEVDEVSVIIHYLECQGFKNAEGPCTVKNAVNGTAGLLITTSLRGLLGLIDPSKSAGILFEPNTGKVFLEFAALTAPCTAPETAVEGSVAGLLSPTGKSQKTGLITVLPVSSTGKQEVTEILTLAGLIKPKLISFGAAESTQEQTAEVEYGGIVEVD